MDGEHKICSCEYPPVPHCPCSQRENCVLVPLMAENARLLARVGELEGAICELLAAIDAVSEFASGPTQEQYDRQIAALVALQALASHADGAGDDGEGKDDDD